LLEAEKRINMKQNCRKLIEGPGVAISVAGNGREAIHNMQLSVMRNTMIKHHRSISKELHIKPPLYLHRQLISHTNLYALSALPAAPYVETT
jgi:hypothetical protein